MASANHSEQKGQDWGEEREGTQTLAHPSASLFLGELTPGPGQASAASSQPGREDGSSGLEAGV